MFIKRLKPNVYDVFIGNGWNNWFRVQRHGGDVHVIKGNNPHVGRDALKHVKERICK